MEIRVWGFQNYRDCGLHAIPINLKSPHSDFPINKHLQCMFVHMFINLMAAL
jgi:hypothetical protein